MALQVKDVNDPLPVAVLAAIAVAASSCGGEETAGGDAGGTCQPAGTALEVLAEDISFDKGCLAAPSGQLLTIKFTNNDRGIPHNVAIYTDPSASESLFVGEIFQGVDSRTYEVPALDRGTYFFTVGSAANVCRRWVGKVLRRVLLAEEKAKAPAASPP